MKSIKFISVLIVVVILGGALGVKMFTKYIPIGSTGVRTQEYAIFGSRGIIPQDFGPGWHRNLGPIDTWVLFDSTVQTLTMPVQVQSADGYAVSVDMTTKYRIMEGKAYKLYQDTGSGVKYKTIVQNEAQRAYLALFGQMKTEDFYNPQQRREGALRVKQDLSEALADNFVEVIDVLIRDLRFDPQYEKKIQRKKLADQEVEYNKSMAGAEEMRGKTQVIEAETERLRKIIVQEKEAELIRMQAETDREIATIKAEGEKYATEKKADADLILAQKEAEGQLLEKKAEAEGEKLRNEAMRGVGGSTIVALEAARNLNLTEVTVSTMDIDLLDLDAMATKLGVPEVE